MPKNLPFIALISLFMVCSGDPILDGWGGAIDEKRGTAAYYRATLTSTDGVFFSLSAEGRDTNDRSTEEEGGGESNEDSEPEKDEEKKEATETLDKHQLLFLSNLYAAQHHSYYFALDYKSPCRELESPPPEA